MTTSAQFGLEVPDVLGAAQLERKVEALLYAFDTACQISVLDRDLTTPPTGAGATVIGDRYWVAVGASGAWAGFANHLARALDTTGATWAFMVPKRGWIIDVVDENVRVYWNGTALSALITGGGGGLVDGDYGDIVVGGTGTTMTIDSRVVSPAKMFAATGPGSALRRKTASGGDWEDIPLVGTSFPTNPFDGMEFTRTDLQATGPYVFRWDATRAKWLSIQAIELKGAVTSAGAASVYLFFDGLVQYTDAIGMPIPYDMTVVEAHSFLTDSTTGCNFFIRRTGVNGAVHVHPTGTSAPSMISTLNMNTNIAIAASAADCMGIRVTTAGTPIAGGAGCRFVLKRRAT